MIRLLQLKIQSLEMTEKDQKKVVLRLTESNNEWETKTKQLFVEIQQNEIIQEKKDYERSLKFNEVVNGYKDQKDRIKALEDQVTLLHHEKSVAISKLQMVN